MKYQILAAGAAALAPIASASNVNRRQWGLNHNHVQYVTNVEVITVYDTITVFGDAPPATTSAAAPPVAPSSASASTSAALALAVPPSSVDSSSVAATSRAAETPSSAAAAAPSSPADAATSEAQASSSAQSANNMIPSSAPVAQAKASTTLATSVAATSAVISATSVAKAQATSASSSASSGKNITTSNLSPNGKKAGLSGYVGIQNLQAFTDLSPHISWYSDYTANTPSSGHVMGVGMLWAASGSGCGSEVSNRVTAFDNLVSTTTPEIMFGFYEPDCNCPDSSAMSTSQGQAAWNSLIAPLKAKGSILGSPSMCKQKDETWLTPFKSNIDADWDVTSVHINKPNITGVKQDIEYYASTYGKPIWVSEFACVDDHSTWEPCTDQDQINQFINDAVAFFQANDSVVAYGPSNGNGLGTTWPLTTVDGKLSESGTTYLNAIKNL